MAGEATSRRRGRQVRHRREHQVHPPGSHPQADTQVIIHARVQCGEELHVAANSHLTATPSGPAFHA